MASVKELKYVYVNSELSSCILLVDSLYLYLFNILYFDSFQVSCARFKF